MSNLINRYKNEIVPKLKERFQYKNAMQVPRLRKIIVSFGMGGASKEMKIFEEALNDISQVTGQKPAIRRARKSIAGFNLRDGMPVGALVTLRGVRMFEFLERFLSIALPRTRDFRGLPLKSFDGRGGYSMGVKEHIVFPEIDMDKTQRMKGYNISFDTSASSKEETFALLESLGMPFQKN